MGKSADQGRDKSNLPTERHRSRRVAKVVKDQKVGGGWHWSFGWLRRPECDNHYGYCYEEPSGDLIYTNRKDHQHIAYLDKWKDGETGEFFCSFNQMRTGQNLILHGRRKIPSQKIKP
jgi:hypothetical protein